LIKNPGFSNSRGFLLMVAITHCRFSLSEKSAVAVMASLNASNFYAIIARRQVRGTNTDYHSAAIGSRRFRPSQRVVYNLQ
jgi:hypothetical protein